MIKNTFITVAALFLLNSCQSNLESNNVVKESSPLMGTWKLISGTQIQGSDTLVTLYTQDQEMIKIINETHFSFLRHDLNNGKGSSAIFVAGGGKYSLDGNKYIEHLEYCNLRAWENNDFELAFSIDGDTLLTTGIEKIEELNIDHINTEKFVRVR